MVPTTTLVSVEEYLHTNYKPACEYREGVLRQKPMPTRKHSVVQGQSFHLILSRYPEFEPATELTVRTGQGRFLVPDLGVQLRAHIQDPYPTRPIHLCIEILSPEDRLADAGAKCEEYAGWGVPHNWVVDPETRRAWEFQSGTGLVEVPSGGALTAGPISIPLAELFAIL